MVDSILALIEESSAQLQDDESEISPPRASLSMPTAHNGKKRARQAPIPAYSTTTVTHHSPQLSLDDNNDTPLNSDELELLAMINTLSSTTSATTTQTKKSRPNPTKAPPNQQKRDQLVQLPSQPPSKTSPLRASKNVSFSTQQSSIGTTQDDLDSLESDLLGLFNNVNNGFNSSSVKNDFNSFSNEFDLIEDIADFEDEIDENQDSDDGYDDNDNDGGDDYDDHNDDDDDDPFL